MFIKAATIMASFSGTFFAMLIVGGSNAIGGGLQFANAIDINTSIANQYHHIIAATTCIDQSVTLGIFENDIDNFDAQDVSSYISPKMVKDDMVLSKVILNADNGNCDIELDIDGEATVMMYRPSSGYEGLDKCVYEMCASMGLSEEMDTEECHEVTMDIHTVDCSLPSLLAGAEETVVGVDEERNVSEDSQETLTDEQQLVSPLSIKKSFLRRKLANHQKVTWLSSPPKVDKAATQQKEEKVEWYKFPSFTPKEDSNAVLPVVDTSSNSDGGKVVADFSESIQHWNAKNNNNGLAQMNEGSSHRSRSRSRVTTTTSATTTAPLLDVNTFVEVVFTNTDTDEIVQSGGKLLQQTISEDDDCEEALAETLQEELDDFLPPSIDVDGEVRFVSAIINEAGDLVVTYEVPLSVSCTQDLEACRAVTQAAVDNALQDSILSGDIPSVLIGNLNEETNCATTGTSCQTLLDQCGITEDFSFESDVCLTNEGDCRPSTSTTTSSTTVVSSTTTPQTSTSSTILSTSETSTSSTTVVSSTTTPQTTEATTVQSTTGSSTSSATTSSTAVSSTTDATTVQSTTSSTTPATTVQSTTSSTAVSSTTDATTTVATTTSSVSDSPCDGIDAGSQCSICGVGMEVSNPDATVDLSPYTFAGAPAVTASCGDFQQEGLNGNATINSSCGFLGTIPELQSGGACGCQACPSNIGSEPLSSKSYPTYYPTYSPTSVENKENAPVSSKGLQVTTNNLGTGMYDECQGDCDSHSDCKGDDLMCFYRDDNEKVPGCDNSNAVSGVDYCVKRTPEILQELEDNLGEGSYGRCEGDCDSDIDCKDGYVCHQRDEWEEVYGCVGWGEYGLDYCREVKDEEEIRSLLI